MFQIIKNRKQKKIIEKIRKASLLLKEANEDFYEGVYEGDQIHYTRYLLNEIKNTSQKIMHDNIIKTKKL